MKNLPIGRQSFEAIMKEDLLYIDKTRQIYHLIRAGQLYFLSRPRRFGKSLLLSTLVQIFQGNKALFKNLYIGKETNYSFENYPVLQFNFSVFGHKVENLAIELKKQIQEYASEYGVSITDISLSTSFSDLVEGISKKGQPVVILIDEYDKPIIDFLTDIEKAERNRDILRDFFSPLKDLEAQNHLRFLFITGVSKFSKVSLFSDLNNLNDLSIEDPLSNDLLGITQVELETGFEDYILATTKKLKTTKAILLKTIKTWYNGYSFDGETKLYNPFSLLTFFHKKRFGNYWFATGTPTFLVNTIRDKGINPREFEGKEVDEIFLNKFSLEELDMTGLLFQTGYLTIKKVEEEQFVRRYFLNYPNKEVRASMMRHLVEAFTYTPSSATSDALIKMQRGLRTGNIELFIEHLTIILSNIKYNWQPPKQYKTEIELFKMWEGYFHSIIYLITAHMDMYVQAEIAHYKGRLDLLVETKEYIYLMEFKLDESADTAVAQIKNKAYAAPYKDSAKKIFLVGINFSREERNIENWKMEIWNRDS